MTTSDGRPARTVRLAAAGAAGLAALSALVSAYWAAGGSALLRRSAAGWSRSAPGAVQGRCC